MRRTADDLNDIIARATRQRWSPTVLLEHIVTAELEERRRRSIERRLTAARLGRFTPIADWDWDWPTALDRPALERVLALDFLDRAENVLLVGAQGLGKTMLAKNIVQQVVLAGHSARCITASDLVNTVQDLSARGVGLRVLTAGKARRSTPPRRPGASCSASSRRWLSSSGS